MTEYGLRVLVGVACRQSFTSEKGTVQYGLSRRSMLKSDTNASGSRLEPELLV